MDIPSLYSLFQQHPVISTDTRKIIPGSIYFALKGENFDGNAFASMALKNGAALAVVSDPALLSDPRMIYTSDTLQTLQHLATHHRNQFQIPVLAITGSNGKTTTKELVHRVLSIKYKVHATSGNLNNHIGVPLTLLAIPPGTEIIVCEMGANHQGEIAMLCQIAAPTHGMITNIGNAHLEGFGGIEGVEKAKGELFDYLDQHQGMAFVNGDDWRVRKAGDRLARKIMYGFEASIHPDIQCTYSLHSGQSGFVLQDIKTGLEFRSNMFGQYNATNMLAAYAVGLHFAVEPEMMAKHLSAFIPGANRSEILDYKGCIIIKDAYNANPSSMELAIRAFADLYPDGWVILGDMKELGTASAEAHDHIFRLAAGFKFERIYLVGESFETTYKLREPNDSRIIPVRHIQDIKKNWHWNDCQGKALLLKGSRSMHLEQLFDK